MDLYPSTFPITISSGLFGAHAKLLIVNVPVGRSPFTSQEIPPLKDEYN